MSRARIGPRVGKSIDPRFSDPAVRALSLVDGLRCAPLNYAGFEDTIVPLGPGPTLTVHGRASDPSHKGIGK